MRKLIVISGILAAFIFAEVAATEEAMAEKEVAEKNAAIDEASSDEVAFVETVTGRVVASAAGRPILLAPLDVITNRTKVDLLANSELRLCHYRTSQFLTVKGPAQIIVSVDGGAPRPENGAGRTIRDRRSPKSAPAANASENCRRATRGEANGARVTARSRNGESSSSVVH
jgi:hypothetical protein